MRNRFRLIFSVLLAAAMLLQCFAVGAVFLDDPEPTEPPAETEEPVESADKEKDAPIIEEALVRRADSEESTSLRSGMTLSYQTAVFHFEFSDPAGESGQEPSGIDLASCALSIDGRQMSDVLTDETDGSLTASVTLGNGRHSLCVTARDHDGNKSETTYTVTVNNPDSILPVYTVAADLDYAPLDGHVAVRIPSSVALSVNMVRFSRSVPENNVFPCGT